MACSPAPAARALLAEATAKWPNRNKASDGICPSAEHTAANPDSDHERGNAADLTDDPGAGVDTAALARLLINKRDPRVKYIIVDKMIYGPGSRYGWTGGPYTGKNPHTSHMHVSILEAGRNDTSPWFGNSVLSGGGLGIGVGTGQPGAGGSGGGIGLTDAIGLGASQLPTDPISQVTALLGFVTDPGNWRRVAMFVSGLVLATLGVTLWVIDSRGAKSVAGAVTTVASRGTVDGDLIDGGDNSSDAVESSEGDDDADPK